jgi:hypothetical protein
MIVSKQQYHWRVKALFMFLVVCTTLYFVGVGIRLFGDRPTIVFPCETPEQYVATLQEFKEQGYPVEWTIGTELATRSFLDHGRIIVNMTEPEAMKALGHPIVGVVFPTWNSPVQAMQDFQPSRCKDGFNRVLHPDADMMNHLSLGGGVCTKIAYGFRSHKLQMPKPPPLPILLWNILITD